MRCPAQTHNGKAPQRSAWWQKLLYMYVYFSILCRDEASEASHVVDERASTYRLLEPISHPSRAEDLDDLRRLQKSSTKPRKGKLRGCPLIKFVQLGIDFPKAMSLVTRPTDFQHSCSSRLIIWPTLVLELTSNLVLCRQYGPEDHQLSFRNLEIVSPRVSNIT